MIFVPPYTYYYRALHKINTYIHFDQMHFYAFHGVDPQELAVGNNYSIELSLKIPFGDAMKSDALEDTINYAEIFEAIEEVMSTPSKLLEHVVGRIIDTLQQRFPSIAGGRIALYKENPPITGKIDRVGVIVEW